jgi:serine/threonine-protein kinase
LHYLAPEQVSGSRATAQSDIYSVGVTLYEMLTGKMPIEGSNNYEIMMGHMNKVPRAPHVVAPQVPVYLSDAVMRALEKEPERRFATASDFLHALRLSQSQRETTTAFTQPLPQPVVAVSRAGSGSIGPSGSVAPKTPSGSGLASLPLEEVTRKLAVYIGPVAKFVVKKLAAQTEDLDIIYREAAKQISSETDRAAFLKSRRQ